jgi:hypothetical protein
MAGLPDSPEMARFVFITGDIDGEDTASFSTSRAAVTS